MKNRAAFSLVALLVMGLLLTASGCGLRSADEWLAQLNDPDVVKRREAIRELAERRPNPRRSIPALAAALHDPSSFVRHDAAWALGKFGPQGRAALPALGESVMRDPARPVREAAASSLKRIDPEVARRLGIR
jgi:HEAT repeat protein